MTGKVIETFKIVVDNEGAFESKTYKNKWMNELNNQIVKSLIFFFFFFKTKKINF